MFLILSELIGKLKIVDVVVYLVCETLFKSELSKLYGRQPIWQTISHEILKGYLPQNLLSPFLNAPYVRF